jgi:poly(A) polymerase
MIVNLQPQPWMTSPAIKAIFNAIPDSKEKLRFVGGCVRDALLGQPVDDIDIATPYVPEQVIKFLQAAGLTVLPTGIDHGTVMAVIDGTGYEITTLRHDVSTDGRHAIVAYTDQWQEDAARRDFTFNALYLSTEGTLYDPWQGVQDLQNGIVRFIGDPQARIKEDYLRILRYFRFYARFSRQDPDQQTLQAIQTTAAGLEQISGERIHSEMTKLFSHPLSRHRTPEVFALMQASHVLPFILNITETPALYTALCQQEAQYQISPHLLRALFALSSGEPAHLAWIKGRWKLSNKERTYLKKLLELCNQTVALHESLYRFGPDLTRSVILLKAAQHLDSAAHHQVEEDLAKIAAWQRPTFPLTGQTLIKLGLTPGPALGKKLITLEQQWIDSEFKLSRQDLLGSLQA